VGAEGGAQESAEGVVSLWSTREWLGRPSATVILADNVPMTEIPADGYRMVPDIPRVGASAVVPSVWDGEWQPEDSLTVEWRLTAAGESFDVGDLIPESLRLNGTVAPVFPVAVEGGALIARFPRAAALQSLSGTTGGTSRSVVLTGVFADSLRLESPVTIEVVRTTAVRQRADAASLFDVGTPRPNPGSRVFDLPVDITERGGRLHVSVVDVKGRLIATLADRQLGPGRHWISWQGTSGDGIAVPNGTYWIVVKFEGQRRVAKVTVLR
jgi:hypothetical protein